MKVLIVSGGKPPSSILLEREAKDVDIVIGADSGANCLYENGIIPHYLIGDFDSINKEVFISAVAHECTTITYPVEKDYTDTELALRKAIELGAGEVVFLGCTGSRLDHMLGNLGLLKVCLETGISGVLKDDNNTVFLVNKPLTIEGEKGDIFSLQAYCDEVEGLSIEGSKYALFNYNLKLGDPLTISNIFINNRVNIAFKKGELLILLTRD